MGILVAIGIYLIYIIFTEIEFYIDEKKFKEELKDK